MIALGGVTTIDEGTRSPQVALNTNNTMETINIFSRDKAIEKANKRDDFIASTLGFVGTLAIVIYAFSQVH